MAAEEVHGEELMAGPKAPAPSDDDVKNNWQQKMSKRNPREESNLESCGSDALHYVSSFLLINEKARFRNSSLGLHLMLLGCVIDLTECNKIRKVATIEFVMERLVPLQKFSNRNLGHEARSCFIALTINGLNVGARLNLAGQYAAKHHEARNSESIGFGWSWSVVGLSLIQESSARMLPKLLTAIRANQITKIVIGSSSAGILTTIGQAVERGNLTGLQQISLHNDDEQVDEDEGLEPDILGTLGNFGSAFHSLDLSYSQTMDISGLGKCINLRTLNLINTQVADVSALGSCSHLHTLNLRNTQVADVSALGSCSNLHRLHLGNTQVVNVSALGSCSSLRTLCLASTQVVNVSALGSCSSLHTLNLMNTQVADVSALGSCSSLRVLCLSREQVAGVGALGSCSVLYCSIRHLI